MSRIVFLRVLLVQLCLVGCIACPAFAQGAQVTVVQPAPVAAPSPTVVVQPAPAAVQPQTVIVQPYTVLEGSDSITIDPEDYYYQDKDIYYHHTYQVDKDVVVTTVPSEYRFVHSRIDISKVPQKHFRHAQQVEKTETTTTKVNPVSGTASVEKETTTTSKK